MMTDTFAEDVGQHKHYTPEIFLSKTKI